MGGAKRYRLFYLTKTIKRNTIMPKKTGGGGYPEEYSPESGRYVNSGYYGNKKNEAQELAKKVLAKRRELERKYNDDLPIKTPKKHYSPKLDSAVMNKYSSVRKSVEKNGYAVVVVNDGKYKYLVKINNSKDDFDYDILKKDKI